VHELLGNASYDLWLKREGRGRKHETMSQTNDNAMVIAIAIANPIYNIKYTSS